MLYDAPMAILVAGDLNITKDIFIQLIVLQQLKISF